MDDKDGFVDLGNARSEEQKKVMEAIATEGECPFCRENLAKYHKKPIILSGLYWILTENQWPYENTRVHLLLIATVHAEKISDVPSEAGEERWRFLRFAEREYGVNIGAACMRFGWKKDSGAATVRHLHEHFIVPVENPPEAVKFKIGK